MSYFSNSVKGFQIPSCYIEYHIQTLAYIVSIVSWLYIQSAWCSRRYLSIAKIGRQGGFIRYKNAEFSICYALNALPYQKKVDDFALPYRLLWRKKMTVCIAITIAVSALDKVIEAVSSFFWSFGLCMPMFYVLRTQAHVPIYYP